MKNFATYFLAAAVGLTMLGCSKDDENEPDKAALLTAKNWRYTGDVSVLTTNGVNATVDNYATTTDACEKDNYLKFQTDKSVRFDEGASVCPNSSQTQSATWDFNSDRTKLLISSANSPLAGQLTIVELSSTTLKLSSTETNNNVTEVNTQTFTAF